MDIAICCQPGTEQDLILNVLRTNCAKQGVSARFEVFTDREQFALTHQHRLVPIVVVAFDGANGQETALQALSIKPDCRLVWLSSDRMFAPQSTRMGVSHFLTKPVDRLQLWQTFLHCL